MTPDNFINSLPVSLKLIVVFTGLALLTACGGGSDEKAAKKKTAVASAPTASDAASTATVTTGPMSMEADTQLDFYAEQYLRPEERLKRRQDRIKAALAN
jgi:hypothetical protein